MVRNEEFHLMLGKADLDDSCALVREPRDLLVFSDLPCEIRTL